VAAEEEIRERVVGWRRSEDHLYASVLQVPELYTSCIRLVRAIANTLGSVDKEDELLRLYGQDEPDSVSSIADSLDLPRREFLDYDLARDTAFYLRYQEIVGARTIAEVQERITKARLAGEEWAVLYEEETRSRGHVFFQRLEMHLSDGNGLRSGSELDMEKGRVYVVEPVCLDPESGQRRQGVHPPDRLREFMTQDEMKAAVDALRARYSAGSGQSDSERGAPNG
jgi:hypothetical protein